MYSVFKYLENSATAERKQHSSQITPAAADSTVSCSADIQAPSVGLTLLLQ
jgi:hypothetical protein